MKEIVDNIMNGMNTLIACEFDRTDACQEESNYIEVRVRKEGRGFVVDFPKVPLTGKTIDILGRQLCRMATEIENRKKFVEGQTYYCVSFDFKEAFIHESTFENESIDISRIMCGNAFLTKEEAEANKDKIIGKYQELLDKGIL